MENTEISMEKNTQEILRKILITEVLTQNLMEHSLDILFFRELERVTWPKGKCARYMLNNIVHFI